MKLYYIELNTIGWGSNYDSAVVASPDELTAKMMHPDGRGLITDKGAYTWTEDINEITIKYLGEADIAINQGVICASYNAE